MLNQQLQYVLYTYSQSPHPQVHIHHQYHQLITIVKDNVILYFTDISYEYQQPTHNVNNLSYYIEHKIPNSFYNLSHIKL